MRVNNILYQTLRTHPKVVLIVLSSVLLCVEFLCFGVSTNYDSASYWTAWQSLTSGNLDLYRTPVYPLLLGGASCLFGTHAITAIILCQMVIFECSVFCFWSLTSLFTSSRKAMFCISAIYALAPGISTYTLCVLTESLSISGIVVLLWILHRFYQTPCAVDAIFVVVLVVSLIFLRPVFLYLGVVVCVLVVLWWIQRRVKQAVTLLVSLLLTLSLLVCYVQDMQRIYGLAALTRVSLVNDAKISITEQFTDQSDHVRWTTPEFQTIADSCALMGAASFITYQQNLSTDSLKAFVQEAKQQLGPVTWLRKAYNRLWNSADDYFLHNYAHNLPGYLSFVAMIPLKLYLLYVLLVGYSFILVYLVAWRRQISWLHWTLCLSCYGNIAVMTLGSFGEWSRLFVPSVPLMLLILLQLYSSVRIRLDLSAFTSSAAGAASDTSSRR